MWLCAGRILLKGDNITLMMNTYVNSFSFSLSPPLITRTNGCSPTEFSFRSSYLLHKLNFLLQIHSVLSCTNINTLISGENEMVLACVWVTALLACDLGFHAAYVNACCWVLPFRCLLLFWIVLGTNVTKWLFVLQFVQIYCQMFVVND